MTKKERAHVLTLLEEIRSLVLLDERTQRGQGQAAPGPVERRANQSPEHMAELRELRAVKLRDAKRARLMAELDALTAPSNGARG